MTTVAKTTVISSGLPPKNKDKISTNYIVVIYGSKGNCPY